MTRDNEQRSNIRVPDINKLTLAGRVGKDPELKYTQSGKAYCNFSVANTKYGRNYAGDRTDETLWMNVTCWEKTAEFAAEHLHKGSPVIVEGRLKEESWTDRDSGQERKIMKLQADRLWPLAWDNAEGGVEQEQPRGRQRREPEGESPYKDGDDFEEEPLGDDTPF